jgi:tetratricopeptide (TPR) repeat protein
MSLSGFHRRFLAAALGFLSMMAGLAHAEPVIDEFVSGARVSAANGCAMLRVHFNVRVRYVGHFPQDHGDELRITLQPIDPTLLGQLKLIRREGVIVDDAAAAGIRGVTLDLDDASVGPTLRVQFFRSVAFDVKQFGSFDSIAVAVPQPNSTAVCKVDNLAPPGAIQSNDDVAPTVSHRAGQRPGRASPADIKFVEASLDEARYAIKQNRFKDAITLLEKVLRLPENKYSAEAQELLGEALQKSGQAKQASAEYEDYLRRYPNAEGSARVMQRLGSLTEAGMGSPPDLRGSIGVEPPKDQAAARRDLSTWTMSGSVSSFYIRDDSYNTLKDISIAPNPTADPDVHRVHQDTFLTNFDLFGTITSDQLKTKFKLAGSDEHRMAPDQPDADRYGISTAYIETLWKEYGVTTRVGRQTRNTGGVIGRFDGAVVSWQADDQYRLNAVAGGANWSRFDAPFKDGKYLYGVSLDIAHIFYGFDASLFAIQQNDRWLLDRRAVGTEFRYFSDNKSLLGMVDYDVYFQRLNALVTSGSWTFEDKSVLSGTIDYRRVPYLSTWNAIQGQPFLTLFDMLKFYSQQDVRQVAIDRTPSYESAMASYSRPLNDNFQVNVDATVTRLSGTVPSAGVDGTLPSGREYYFSSQLVGTNLFTSGDMYSGALRYANLADSNVYFLDLNGGYPWSDNIRLSPRFRAGFRNGKYIQLKETTILPSLLIDYKWTKNLSFEGEIGTKWIWSDSAGTRSTTKSLYVTVGLRSDFNMDGAYRCAGLLAPCSGLLFGQPKLDPQTNHDRIYYGDVLFDTTAPPVTSAFSIEGGVRYWLNRGDNKYDYFADQTSSARVSRLSYTNLTSNSGELFFRSDARRGLIRDVFLKGYIGGGAISGAKLYDEDFPPFVGTYSKTASDSSGKLRYGSIDLGYNFYTDRIFRLGAFVGFHSWSETANAYGCGQLAYNLVCVPAVPRSLRLITEHDQWTSFRVGAIADVNLTDRLKWTGEVALTSTSQRALDTHYFTFGNDPSKGHGTGFQAETSLKYQLTDRLAFGLGMRWWHFETHAIDFYGQLLKYRTDRYGVFAQASYRLNWGDFPIEPDDAP